MNESALPRFSVVMPNRNGSASVAEALEAVLAAGGPEIEVIVVDDASTDDSRRIVSNYPVRLISLEAGGGAAPARNRGAAAATGNVLVFIDNDVVIPPDTFAIFTEHFRRPSAAGVIGLLRPVTRFRNLCSQYKNYYMHHTYMRLPERVSVFYTSLAAVRSRVFAECGGFDEAYRSATIEDLEFGIRLVKAGCDLVIDKRLQVDHIRHYNLKTLLKTAFRRSSGSTKIALRDRLASRKNSYVTTSRAFLGGIALVFLAAAALLPAVIFSSWIGGAVAGFLALAAVAGNFPFLLGLARHTRPAYFPAGALLLLADLFAHGCGNVYGVVSFWRGRRY